MSKRAEAGWTIAGFSLLAMAITHPVVRALASRLPGDLGDPLLSAWTLAWDADRLRHGLRGVWDAPNYFPYRHTLLYSDHLLGIAVFTAPLQWLTGNPILVYNLAYLASFVLAGVGMYVLVRELTGRAYAAAIAGAIFACQPFRISHLAHLQWLMTGWLPLALWALHRYFARGALRDLLLSTVFFLLQSLTAAYFTYFALLPLVVVGVAEAWRSPLPARRLAQHLLLAAVLAAAVTAPVARAYYQVREQSGTRRSLEDIESLSADVGDYFSAPLSLRVWHGVGSGRGEHELFPGAIALVLAAIGVASFPRRRREIGAYAIVGLLAFVCSLGIEPTAWGHRLGVPGPYALLLRVVPGLDGLRAVARLAVVVQAALAVLAAFGAMTLVDHLTPRARLGAAAALVVGIVAEGWAPFPTAALQIDPADRDAYAYLRTLPNGGALELPTTLEGFYREFRYQYMTLIHRHPVVNGHSGYLTPLLTFLGAQAPFSEPQTDAAIAMVRAIGVRYLVIHRASFEDPAIAAMLLDHIERGSAQVIGIRRFAETTVVTLAPPDPAPALPALQRVPTAAIHATASHSADRVPAMFDGDPDSRWLSGSPQAGDEWIDLALDRPRDVRIVGLQLATRSFGDEPRDLAIDVRTADGERTLFRGPVLAQFARALLANGAYPTVQIVLPANRAQAVRLRQLGTARRFWSIHELQLWESPD